MEIEEAQDLFFQAPVAICIVNGCDYIFELANEKMLEFLGRTKDIIRKPLKEVLTESKEQGLVDMFDSVRQSGNAYKVSSFPASILINGVREQRYFDITFKPYKYNSADPIANSIFCVAHNVTEQVLTKQKLEANETELQKRVDERIVELDSLNAQLSKSNTSLEEFALAASHDLKVPLRKINVFAQKLKSELQERLTQTQTDLFNRIEMSSTRMATLIDDLLSLSHVSKAVGEFAEVDLSLKVRNALEDLEIEISEKSATVTVGKLPIVQGNRRHLQQLFQNLIGNAIKYTAPGVVPVINITSKEVAGHEVINTLPQSELNRKYNLIEVSDNGIGFDQHFAEQIFKVFTRLHSASDYTGTGIGLSIVQRIVDNHKGYIWAESTVGKGSKFSILLPVL